MKFLFKAVHRVTKFSVEHRTVVLIICAGLFLLAAALSPLVHVDSAAVSLLPNDLSSLKTLRKYSVAGDDSYYIMLAIKAKKGQDLFNPQGLATFERVIKNVEKLEGVQQGALSPFNYYQFVKSGRSFSPAPLAIGRRAPRNAKELAYFKNSLQQAHLAQHFVVSPDQTMLNAIFTQVPHNHAQQFRKNFQKAIAPLHKYYKTYATGDILFDERIVHYTNQSLTIPLAVCFIIIELCFFFAFRLKRLVLIPPAFTATCLLVSIVFMAVQGIHLTMVTMVFPPILLAISSSYVIHFFTHYVKYSEHRKELGGDKAVIIESSSDVQKTIIPASLTTILGFVSLYVSNLPQIRYFASVMIFGIAFATVLTFTLLPALETLAPPLAEDRRKRIVDGNLSRLMSGMSQIVIKGRWFFFSILLVVLALFFVAYPHVSYKSNYVSYFPQKDPLIGQGKEIVRKLGSYQAINVTFVAPHNQRNYFLKPAHLRRLAAFEDGMRKDPVVTSSFSFVDLVREATRVTTGRADVPNNPVALRLIGQYIRVFLRSKGNNRSFKQVANDRFSQVTTTFYVYDKRIDAFLQDQSLKDFVSMMNVQMKVAYPSGSIEHHYWSVHLAFLQLSRILKLDITMALGLALLLIFGFSYIYFRKFFLALAATLPLLFGVSVNIIFMVLAGIPMDILALMVSSIVIGLGVDDAIHFLVQYRMHQKEGNGLFDTLFITYKDSGRAIFLTTVAIVAGLSALTFASFKGVVYIGILLIISLSSTMIGTLLFLPSFLAIFTRHKRGEHIS